MPVDPAPLVAIGAAIASQLIKDAAEAALSPDPIEVERQALVRLQRTISDEIARRTFSGG